MKEKLHCASCHITPWGGGPRTLLGKTFGSHGATPSPTSSQDLFYGDLRNIAYYPFDQLPQQTHGVALMEAAASGSAAVSPRGDTTETRGLLTYQMSPLAGNQVRDAYIRLRFGTPTTPGLSHLVIGRFYVPFGLLTDEHRTYTRIQTNMTFNNFSEGVAFEAEPNPNLSFTAALVNDFQSGGAFSTSDIPYGLVGNLRWNPVSFPGMLGLSANFQHSIVYPEPVAGSLYLGLSLDRATEEKLRGSLLFESVIARNWNQPAFNTGLVNPGLTTFFIPTSDAAYASQIESQTSVGFYGQAKFHLSPHFLFLYKFDLLALDSTRMSDNYTRHGVGFETYFGSNLILNARVEFASSPSEVQNSDALASQSDFIAMLRLWI